MKWLRWLALSVLLANGCVAVAQPIDARLLEGKGQRTEVDHAFALPFSVRVTDRASGAGLANAVVTFGNNVCVLPPEAPPDSCPLTGDPGHFAGGGDFADVLTDANGVARSPVYFAGHQPGIIGVIAFVPPQQVGSRIITVADSVHAGVPDFGPLGQLALAVPTLRTSMLVLSALAVGVLGLLTMRRRSL